MHKIVLSSLIAGIVGFTSAVYATGDKTITSVGYVTQEVGKKQAKIPARGSGLTESVVTYTGTAGTVGEKGVYQKTGAYNATTKTQLVEAETVNTAVQNGLNGHLERVDTDANGTLWRIKSISSSDVFVPHGS